MSQSNPTPVASRTRWVASVSSGPVPSPGIRVTRCGIGGGAYTQHESRQTPFVYGSRRWLRPIPSSDPARLSSATLTIVAQAARGRQPAVPESEVEQGENAAAKFLIRWRGEADPRAVKALDTYWISAAEHGLNASTFTARIAASTGADCAAVLSSAVGTLSGPLHGGAPARVLPMIDGAAKAGDPERYVRDMLDRGERVMGFGHRVYRAYDPRATVLKRTAMELGSPRG